MAVASEAGVAALTDRELLRALVDRFDPPDPPPCPVCGEGRALALVVGGHEYWYCSPRDRESGRYREGRGPHAGSVAAEREHLLLSVCHRPHVAEPLVRELLRRFNRLTDQEGDDD